MVREYPCDEGDPYYPVPRPDNELLYKRYEGSPTPTLTSTFVGRLAQYRYYNMDQAVAAGMTAAGRVVAALAR